MGDCGTVPSKLIVRFFFFGDSCHSTFSVKYSLTHPKEAIPRARRVPVLAGVCRAWYNISRNNA